MPMTMVTATPSTRRSSISSHSNKPDPSEKVNAAPVKTANEAQATDIEKTSSSQPPIDDYDGPDDPLNPVNWPMAKRAFHVFPPAFISLVATLGSSIYTPSFPEIMKIYGVSSTVALLPLSVYVLALALGPLLGAPLSETYGRNFVYRLGPPIAIAFTLGGAFSTNFAAFVICRFFAGVFFSPVLAIGAGTNADAFRPHERALPSVFYVIAPFIGSPLGPLIGGFVATRKGWKWVQLTIVFFAVAAWAFMFLMTETHKGTILKRRNKRLGLPPPVEKSGSRSERVKFLVTVTLFRPIHMLITEPIVAFFSIYTAFNFGVLFTFFAAFPYTFTKTYNFTTEQNGLVFCSIIIGVLCSVPTVAYMNKRFYLPHHHAAVTKHHAAVAEASQSGTTSPSTPNQVAPEHRLYPALLGTILMPIGLFWFAWTARSNIHWISPILSGLPFALGNLLIFMGAAGYLIDTYGALNGASSLAANGVLRYGFGAAFPLFALQMYKALGVQWATSLLGFVSLGLLPIPWVLFRYGHKVRAMSKYPTNPA